MNFNNQELKIKNLALSKFDSNLKLILNPEFKKMIFKEVLDKYSPDKLALILNISRGMLYHYKNNRTKSVSLPIIEKVRRILNLNDEEIERNTINILTSKEVKDKGLIIGRELKSKRAKEKFTINLSVIDLLRKKDNLFTLSIVEWLEKTDWINKIKSQSGVIRNVRDMQFFNDNIKIEYEAYKKGKGFGKCISYLPKNIMLDNDFFYFLGLKFGDGTSGARVGIVNKDYFLIKHSFDFLKKLFPYSKIYLDACFYKKSNKLLIQNIVNKFSSISNQIDVYHRPNFPGDYVFSVYTTNKIFSRIIYWLIENLNDLFKITTFEQKGAFLAGFFDAEGNVNKLDGNLRFSQKIERNVEIISKLLINEGYHIRYDLSNIVIGYKKEYNKPDLNLFKRQIFPFIISPTKKNEINDVMNDYLVKEEYKKIVEIISKNPGINQREISLNLKSKKCHRKLSALLKARFIKKEGKVGESFKYKATVLGLQWIGGN